MNLSGLLVGIGFICMSSLPFTFLLYDKKKVDKGIELTKNIGVIGAIAFVLGILLAIVGGGKI